MSPRSPRFPASHQAPLAWVLLCLAAAVETGCTYGMVSDDVTGDGIPHATVTFEAWPTDTALVYDNATAIPANYAPTFTLNGTGKTWDFNDPGASNYQGMWYLNPYAPKNAGDTTKTELDEGWNRVKIMHSGYDTQYVYRNHQYVASKVYLDGPYAAGPYAAPSGPQSDALAAEASYRLHPTSQTTRRRSPDMIVDPRTLLDCEISETVGTPPLAPNSPTHTCEGAINPDTGAAVQRCLRFSVGTPNVGEGDLWVRGTANSTSVSQYLYVQPFPNATTVDTVAMPASSLVYHPTHEHFHFQDWTRTRLRHITSACLSEDTASACPTVWHDAYKTSFCLEDYRTNADNAATNFFDSHYQPRRGFYAGSTPGYQTCRYDQGIGAGRMDTYRRVLPGQMIDITGLAAGRYWLEVEVNPSHSVVESDYSNNISRVVVVIPAVGTNPSTWGCKKCVPSNGQWTCTSSKGTVTE